MSADNDTEPTRTPTPAGGGWIEQRTGTLIGVTLAVAGLVVITVALGVSSRPPQFPPLGEGPANHPAFAYVGRSDCLVIVEATVHRELVCDLDAPWADLAITNDAVISGDYSAAYVYDRESGALLRTAASGPLHEFSSRGEHDRDVQTDRVDGQARVLVRDGDDLVPVLAVPAPDNFRFYSVREYEPDGDYLVLEDSADRLLLVATDGSQKAWEAATDVRNFTWGSYDCTADELLDAAREVDDARERYSAWSEEPSPSAWPDPDVYLREAGCLSE